MLLIEEKHNSKAKEIARMKEMMNLDQISAAGALLI